jgi:phosphatidyl-myo-inositol dimannoside synthase
MHIGFLTSDLHHGHGWGHYSLSLIEALRANGVKVTVVAPKNTPTHFDFPVHPLLPNLAPAEPRRLAKMAQATLAVRHALRGCDLIHSTVESFAPLAMWAAGERPYLITGHGSYAQAGVDRSPAIRPLYKMAFRRAYRVVCVSHYTARRATAYTEGLRTEVIPNGINADAFAHLPARTQPPGRPTILTVGGVKRRKGTLELIQAASAVRQAGVNVRVVIAGRTDYEPDYTEQVQAAVASHGLEDIVQLLGFVDEDALLGWYGAANVFVLPSINDGWRFEGYGLVHLEASAAGLPVIGTRGCGAEDAIVDGVTGVLIDPQRLASDLPAVLLRLLNDPRWASQLGQAGQQHARAHTWQRAAAQLMTVYQSAGGV